MTGGTVDDRDSNAAVSGFVACWGLRVEVACESRFETAGEQGNVDSFFARS